MSISPKLLRAVLGAASANTFAPTRTDGDRRIQFSRLTGETLIVCFVDRDGTTEILSACVIGRGHSASATFNFRVEIGGHQCATNEHPFDFIDNAIQWLDAPVGSAR